jgi:hypothetical protein
MKDQVNVEVGATYEHYKGKSYKVHGVARHSESLELVVYYECLYPNEMGQMWVRPLNLFTGTVTIEGKTIERFRRV